MATEREIRREVISQLTNVFTNTPDLEEGAEPQPLFDLNQQGWTGNDFMQAYITVVSIFL